MIQLVDVNKSYRASQGEVLKNVNLTIKEKDFIVIRGRSGIGKSTLLRILGLLDLPTSGKVLVDGSETGDRKNKKMKDAILSELRLRTFGFVFQQFNLIPSLTNLENVELPMELARVQGGERRKRAEELLESFGIRGHATRYPGEISVGEQQRVAIARALANKPRVILADEPTVSLDQENSERILGLFKKVNQENNVAVVLTTTTMEASSPEKNYGSTSEFALVEGGCLVERDNS